MDPTSGTYSNLDDAAQAFYTGLGQHDTKAESAGVLYSDADGKFHYSIPTVQHDDAFKLRAQQGETQHLAGIFHTHPGNDQDAQWFSPGDISAAQQLKVPSYIYFEGRKDMRKFVPGETKTTMENLHRMAERVSKGDPVVQQQLIADALRK